MEGIGFAPKWSFNSVLRAIVQLVIVKTSKFGSLARLKIYFLSVVFPKTNPFVNLPVSLLNAGVYLGTFIYKGAQMKLGSAYGTAQMQSNCPAFRSLANFHIEFELFCCPLTATLLLNAGERDRGGKGDTCHTLTFLP